MGFTVSLTALAEKFKADIETVARKSTADVFRAVVQKSPVDTGRFRANWNVSFGAADYTATASTAQGRGAQEAAKALALPVGGIVYLANGLPYASRLENGYSKQAPSGMVRLSVIEFDTFVQQAIKAA